MRQADFRRAQAEAPTTMAALPIATSILPPDGRVAEPTAAQQAATAPGTTAPPPPATTAATTQVGGSSGSGLKRTADGVPEVAPSQKPRVSINQMMKFMNDGKHPLD